MKKLTAELAQREYRSLRNDPSIASFIFTAQNARKVGLKYLIDNKTAGDGSMVLENVARHILQLGGVLDRYEEVPRTDKLVIKGSELHIDIVRVIKNTVSLEDIIKDYEQSKADATENVPPVSNISKSLAEHGLIFNGKALIAMSVLLVVTFLVLGFIPENSPMAILRSICIVLQSAFFGIAVAHRLPVWIRKSE